MKVFTAWKGSELVADINDVLQIARVFKSQAEADLMKDTYSKILPTNMISFCDAVIELLKEQPKWIPINERKPNSCGVYIVARWFIDGCRRKILTDACYFDGSNTWHDDTRVNHSRPYLTDKIVAWMSLPKPPKDGEKDAENKVD